jgi:hypothetical protein
VQMQQSEQQHAAAIKQKPQRKPRQAKVASRRPPAAASKLHPQSQQLQQPDVCTQPREACSQGGAVVVMPATGSDVAAAAAVAAAGDAGRGCGRGIEACKLAAFTVVGPATVLACSTCQHSGWSSNSECGIVCRHRRTDMAAASVDLCFQSRVASSVTVQDELTSKVRHCQCVVCGCDRLAAIL